MRRLHFLRLCILLINSIVTVLYAKPCRVTGKRDHVHQFPGPSATERTTSTPSMWTPFSTSPTSDSAIVRHQRYLLVCWAPFKVIVSDNLLIMRGSYLYWQKCDATKPYADRRLRCRVVVTKCTSNRSDTGLGISRWTMILSRISNIPRCCMCNTGDNWRLQKLQGPDEDGAF